MAASSEHSDDDMLDDEDDDLQLANVEEGQVDPKLPVPLLEAESKLIPSYMLVLA